MSSTRPKVFTSPPAVAQSVARAYEAVRAATDALTSTLAPEDSVVQSMPDASPAKWHLAHTSWFFEEFVLQPFAENYRVYHERFGFLFNSYYESVGPRHARPSRGLLSRPSLDEVRAYRAHVDAHMRALLDYGPGNAALEKVLSVGLHHEQQHQELLLTDVKHLFSCNPLLPAFRASAPARALAVAAPLAFSDFDGGIVSIGHDGGGFAFDNELPRHRVFLQPFRIANRPVTNTEFREFIRAGGYGQAELWLADGWAAVQSGQWARPLYWSESLDAQFTLSGLRELDPHAPVCHISYYEADAYARWAQARLPTEFEWESVAQEQPVHGNFAEDGYLNPQSQSATSLTQLFGDVWEWTSSSYSPYPGFKPLRGALGEYNGKFMMNQWVLRGGSCVTPGSHMRPSYRNFFYPSARWQFSGVRLAADRS